MSTLWTTMADSLTEAWKRLRSEGSIESLLPLLRPVSPYDEPRLLSPLTTIGVVLGLVATSGIALAALAILLAALLALHFLLSEVLGMTVELKPIRF